MRRRLTAKRGPYQWRASRLVATTCNTEIQADMAVRLILTGFERKPARPCLDPFPTRMGASFRLDRRANRHESSNPDRPGGRDQSGRWIRNRNGLESMAPQAANHTPRRTSTEIVVETHRTLEGLLSGTHMVVRAASSYTVAGASRASRYR